MKIIYYLLTLVFGLFGLLALIRSLEVLAFSGGFKPVQILIAIIAFAFSWACLHKGRAK
jgi:hypothetical protein